MAAPANNRTVLGKSYSNFLTGLSKGKGEPVPFDGLFFDGHDGPLSTSWRQ